MFNNGLKRERGEQNYSVKTVEILDFESPKAMKISSGLLNLLFPFHNEPASMNTVLLPFSCYLPLHKANTASNLTAFLLLVFTLKQTPLLI